VDGRLSAPSCLLGINAYCRQFVARPRDHGHERPRFRWGVYIANFTFLVGVAAAAVMMVIPVYIYDNEETARPRDLRRVARGGRDHHVPGIRDS
jgi:Ni/Fe-hydrogenase subunit HybB-like protein